MALPNLRVSMTSTPSADNQNKDQAAPAPDFAASVHTFWQQNGSSVLILCAAVLIGIVGREGWQYYSASRERDITADYAKATTSDRLTAFAASHTGHPLAGVALLRVADGNYTDGNFKAATTSYTQAAAALPNDALKARARLGAAMSQLAAGDKAAGESALKSLSTDATLAKTVRAEATYHLAVFINDSGKPEDAKKLADEVSKIDANGVWAQRAFVLRATLEEGKQAEQGTPAITFKPGGQ